MDKKKTSTKTEQIFSITIWDKMNIFLGVATAATTLIFIILFVLCFVAKMGTNCHGMILGMCGVFASLASAFFIAWIMRMYDIIKKQEQEQKALELIRPYLITIFTTINEFYPQLRDFTTIDVNDTIKYPNDIIYYKLSGSKVLSRSFVNLNEIFKKSFSKLNHDLSECLSAPILYQCNEEVVKLLTSLKLNGLTNNLHEIYTSSLEPFFADTAYIGLNENYKEFSLLYKSLAKIAEREPVAQLIVLTDDERNEYVKEIEVIQEQLKSKHTGQIYKGYDRIQ